MHRDITDPDAVLTEAEAAPMIGKSVAWMQRARWAGNGPPYRKIGRHVRYVRHEMIEYRDSHTARSTADYAA